MQIENNKIIREQYNIQNISLINKILKYKWFGRTNDSKVQELIKKHKLHNSL